LKLIDYYKKEDFGVEHIFTLIKGNERSFIQVEVSWNEYPAFPYFQIALGNNRLIDILFWCWKFGFAFELLGFTWNSWDSEDEETTT
jgi:hypothetical protein